MIVRRMPRARKGRSSVRFGRLIVSGSVGLLVAVLVGFHALLLWQRVVDLTLLQPVPALRWLATAIMMVGLYRLRRRGVSLVRGRAALVLWLLVLLLHVSFGAPGSGPSAAVAGRPVEGSLLVLPAVTAITALLLALLRTLLARVAADSEPSALSFTSFWDGGQSYTLRAGRLPSISCRPPPVV